MGDALEHEQFSAMEVPDDRNMGGDTRRCSIQRG
jgi:hypothetical protein